jgi:hypothetical protein
MNTTPTCTKRKRRRIETAESKGHTAEEAGASRCSLFIVPLGAEVSRARISTWKRQLATLGVRVEDRFSANVQYVAYDTRVEAHKVYEALAMRERERSAFQLVRFVSLDWIVGYLQVCVCLLSPFACRVSLVYVCVHACVSSCVPCMPYCKLRRRQSNAQMMRCSSANSPP